jgi:hypothetical protein
MTDSHHHPKPTLPVELELALRNATWRALTALDSLRTAVEDHVHAERSRGSSQGEIDYGLRSMIEECGPDLDHKDYSADRAGEVTRQVLKWSSGSSGKK